MTTITMPIAGFIKSGKKTIFARKDRTLKIKESQIDSIIKNFSEAHNLLLDQIYRDKEDIEKVRQILLEVAHDLQKFKR